MHGSGRVGAIDRVQNRLDHAEKLGATDTFNTADQATELDAFVARHKDHFADYVFDALPHLEIDAHGHDVRELAMALAQPVGRYVVYGATAMPQSVKTWLILAKGLQSAGPDEWASA